MNLAALDLRCSTQDLCCSRRDLLASVAVGLRLVSPWHVESSAPGIEPMSLHWQVDSYPLYCQGSPSKLFLIAFYILGVMWQFYLKTANSFYNYLLKIYLIGTFLCYKWQKRKNTLYLKRYRSCITEKSRSKTSSSNTQFIYKLTQYTADVTKDFSSLLFSLSVSLIANYYSSSPHILTGPHPRKCKVLLVIPRRKAISPAKFQQTSPWFILVWIDWWPFSSVIYVTGR